LDAAFGRSSGEASKSMNTNSFEDAFSDLIITPSSKADPPLAPQSSNSRLNPAKPSEPQVKPLIPDDEDISPIKRLQIMGFSREESEDALERYDYDLEKASNFLIENSLK
ncbi:11166_t:CDS:1, partial [Acaulospora morrowiae]